MDMKLENNKNMKLLNKIKCWLGEHDWEYQNKNKK